MLSHRPRKPSNATSKAYSWMENLFRRQSLYRLTRLTRRSQLGPGRSWTLICRSSPTSRCASISRCRLECWLSSMRQRRERESHARRCSPTLRWSTFRADAGRLEELCGLSDRRSDSKTPQDAWPTACSMVSASHALRLLPSACAAARFSSGPTLRGTLPEKCLSGSSPLSAHMAR